MSREEFLLVYNAPDEVIDRVQQHADLIAEWGNTGSDHELLFKLEQTLYNLRDLELWLREQTHKNYTDMIVHPSRPNEVAEWITTDKTVRDRLSIYDLVYDGDDAVADVVAAASPGGDIRKYLSTAYHFRFSIEFSLFGPRKVSITGMNPLSIEHIEQLMALDVIHDEPIRDERPQYPEANRILKWAEIVDDEWGLESAALGTIHFPWGDDNRPQAGLDGFVIYDADEDVKEWCSDRWLAVDSWSNRNELPDPYMYPDEFDLRLSDQDWVPSDALRMWWD